MKKKMIAAVSVAALAAGFANAEVKISNNFRIRPVFAEWNFTEADTYSRFSDLDSIQGASDTLTLEAKADYAGVKLVYNNNLTKDSVGFDSYNGWLKFGGLTFTGGLYDSRVANRVTADQNNLSLIEQNWGALYPTAKYDKKTDSFTFNKHNNKFIGQKKLGINANIGALRGVDSDNITALEGTKALSFVADYVISDVGDGKVQIWGAFNKASKEWTDTDHEVDSGYAFRAAYLTDDYSADADLHIRKDTIIAAAFFSLTQKNQIVEGLQATLGFTFAKYDGGVNVAKDNDVKIGGTTVVAKANNTAEEGITYGVDNTYWAIDARARYQIDESLSAGIYTNLTHERYWQKRTCLGHSFERNIQTRRHYHSLWRS